jgi:hypothetical protein
MKGNVVEELLISRTGISARPLFQGLHDTERDGASFHSATVMRGFE